MPARLASRIGLLLGPVLFLAGLAATGFAAVQLDSPPRKKDAHD
ncbi:hypothetical protein [Archangium violaceum]|nr:hypothetical protein [Archangium violaceum]